MSKFSEALEDFLKAYESGDSKKLSDASLSLGKTLDARIRSLNRRIDKNKTQEKPVGAAALPIKQVLPGWSPDYLRKLGDIKTIVDIGVLNGTPALYEAFPDAYLVLVEALPNYWDKCDEILRARRGEAYRCAAGAEDNEIEINFLKDAPARSSILEHVVGGSDNKEKIKTKIRKIDTMFRDKVFEKDILLKIDTEGYEYEIINGGAQFLEKVKFVIAETSVRLRHENSYQFSDLVTLMKKNGFDVYDVLTATRNKARDPGVSIMDLVFRNSKI